MASLDAICDAMATTITAGVQSVLFSYPHVADVDQLPCIIIEPATSDFTGAFARGTDELMFNVFVLCSRNDGEIGQSQLNAFVSGSGPDSIREVLFYKDDLGLGDGTEAVVLRMSGYGGSFMDAQIPMVGAILKVRVYTDGRS